MVEKYSYGAYGNPYEGRFINMQKNNPYGFTGQRFEPELRMYSLAYRTYNPMSMRWMTQDPVRDGTNWYQYCMSDPVNYIDPDGRIVVSGTIVAGTVVTGVVVGATLAIATNQDVREGIADALYEGGKAISDAVQNISRQVDGHLKVVQSTKSNETTGLPNNLNNKNKGPKWKKILKGIGIASIAAEPYLKQYLEYQEVNEEIQENEK